jgi:serine/threonine protein kinase
MNEMIKRRKRFTEPEAAYFMRQLLEATIYLHGELVIHRDLKLGNLFLDRDMNLKLGDLGLATKLESAEEKRKTICGTPNYIAPEVIQGDRASRGHSFEVDVWSMGVILYTVLVGKPPYEAKDVKATYQRILANEYSFPRDIAISDNAKDIIRCMLQSKPEDRPSLAALAVHPFFMDGSIPTSLPSSATHVTPTFRENAYGELVAYTSTNNDSKDSTGPKKPCLPMGSSHRRQPLVIRDVNVEQGISERLMSKSTKQGMDAVKSVFTTVMSVASRTPSTTTPAFEVFDESRPTSTKSVSSNSHRSSKAAPQSRLIDDDLASHAAKALSIRAQDFAPYHTGSVSDPSPRQAQPTPVASSFTPDHDALVLLDMIDRISTVLEITESRKYSPQTAYNNLSLTPISTGGPTKWVSRYVDYTSKYGLGFLLSDGRYVHCVIFMILFV